VDALESLPFQMGFHPRQQEGAKSPGDRRAPNVREIIDTSWGFLRLIFQVPPKLTIMYHIGIL
jgi:hypothetical protein